MTIDVDFLYRRLPAVHRIRDAQSGEPLKALLAVIAEQAGVVEADIDRLYRNWFIETCEDWVVPYIGELIGVRGLRSISDTSAYGPRALVADTLRLRRRKGTALVLEQLAQDCTGWPAHAVEFFQLLATTQNVNHVRPQNQRTPDLRASARLEGLDGPFDDIAHTAAVRRLPDGRYNIPNVGLFVWRLQDYPLHHASARPAKNAVAGLYTFDALGRDLPLFNRPQTEGDISHLAEEINVPAPLRRRPLFDELEARRTAISANRTVDLYRYFDDRANSRFQPVLSVRVDGTDISPEQMHICSLLDIPGSAPRNWPRPAAVPNKLQVAIDPELGRLALPTGVAASLIEVDYAYGMSGDVGGGPYDRRGASTDDLAALVKTKSLPTAQWWQVPAGATDISPSARSFPTLNDALAELQNAPAGQKVVIEIVDDASYPGPIALDIPAREVVLQAGNGHRPALLGDVVVKGDAKTRFALNGLAVDGALKCLGPLAEIVAVHCTLVAAPTGMLCEGVGGECKVALLRSFCSAVKVHGPLASLTLSDSLIDGGNAVPAIDAAFVDVAASRCSVVGTCRMQVLTATDCIFTARLEVARRQEGCVRFSYVTSDSTTPRRYRCQPDLAIRDLTPAQVAAEEVRLTPAFTSLDFRSPAYGQLATQCADELRNGAANGAEMGVWNFLQQPQREANLRNSLDEYLRFGLEAAVIYAT
jgi:hypothetical protein